MVSAKLFAATAALLTAPLASATIYNTTFNASEPFVLHTEVAKGNASRFSNFYITSFHTGAGESTLVGTTNASHAIEFVLNQNTNATAGATVTQRPDPNSALHFALQLLDQEPYLSSAPQGYELVDFGAVGAEATPGFAIEAANQALLFPGDAVGDSGADFAGWALCYVNGTAPYFSVGPQYQLLWKEFGRVASAADYADCADVELIASNPSDV